MKVLIVGHSFVKSLSDYFEYNMNISNARDVRFKLKLDNEVSKVYLYGKRGATVCDGFQVPSSLIESTSPDIIIVELGCNDLALGIEKEIIADQLMEFSLKCQNQYGAKVVVICGILFREDLTERNRDIKILNSLIKNKTETHRNIIFHEHHLIKKQPIRKVSRDGIHPNSALGRKLYTKSITSSVQTAVTVFWRYCNSQSQKVRFILIL